MTMERQEMIAIAQQLRSRSPFAPMTSKELDALPGTEQEVFLETNAGKTVHLFILRPEDLPQGPNALILNFHGGGFIKGRADRDRRYCAELAQKLNCILWDVDYTLAPEAPFPAAVEECAAIAQHAFAHAEELGIDPSRIALAGHSAGGNLVAASILKGGIHPCCALMEYFPADNAVDPMDRYTPEQLQDERNRRRGEMERLYGQFYCDPLSEAAHSVLASPLFAGPEQLAAFPDCLVISAGHDSLRGETEAFARKLMEAGVTVTAKRIPEAIHGFTVNRTEGWERAVALHEQFFAHHNI